MPFLQESILLLLACIDLWTRRLPHALTLPAIGFALLIAPNKVDALAGALLYGAFFWLIRILANNFFQTTALGFGDVVLAALIGTSGVYAGGLALSVGMLVSGAIAFCYRLRGHATIPYGTGLALGAGITLFLT